MACVFSCHRIFWPAQAVLWLRAGGKTLPSTPNTRFGNQGTEKHALTIEMFVSLPWSNSAATEKRLWEHGDICQACDDGRHGSMMGRLCWAARRSRPSGSAGLLLPWSSTSARIETPAIRICTSLGAFFSGLDDVRTYGLIAEKSRLCWQRPRQ